MKFCIYINLFVMPICSLVHMFYTMKLFLCYNYLCAAYYYFFGWKINNFSRHLYWRKAIAILVLKTIAIVCSGWFLPNKYISYCSPAFLEALIFYCILSAKYFEVLYVFLLKFFVFCYQTDTHFFFFYSSRILIWNIYHSIK